MSGRTFEDQENIREWIKLCLAQYEAVPSLRKISVWVEMKSGEQVSPSTVARLLRKMGKEYDKGEWVKK